MTNRMGKRPVPLVPLHPNHSPVAKVRKLLIVLRLLSLGRHRRRLHTHQTCKICKEWVDFSRDPLLPSQIAEVFMQFSRENERPQAASSGRKTQSVCDGHFKILTYTHRDIIYISLTYQYISFKIMLNQRSTHPLSSSISQVGRSIDRGRIGLSGEGPFVRAGDGEDVQIDATIPG